MEFLIARTTRTATMARLQIAAKTVRRRFDKRNLAPHDAMGDQPLVVAARDGPGKADENT
jgi:hypothetical protein